jgi:hypothetical protein
MNILKFAVLPAALALCVAATPVAFAGPDKNHGDGGQHNPGHGPDKNPNPGHGPDKNPNPGPRPSPTPRPNPAPVNFGNGDGYPRDVLCRLDRRIVYTRTERQCRKLQRELGVGEETVVVVKERPRLKKRKVKVQQVVVVEAGYEYEQPAVRYVAEPSRAARMQMERRARKAARRAAYYGDGGVVAYGNGVVVGGYNNTVVVNGNVYGGGQVVTTGKKRKLKKARRVVVQSGTYYNYGDCTCAQ